MKRPALVSLLGLVLFALPALAQQAVEITSDVFTVEETRREAIFTGNVVVVHPTVTVWAPTVVATYGDAGTSDIRTFVASGGVRLKTSEQDATGDQAVFTPGDQLLRLTGNVKVTNSGGTVESTELVVNLATDVSTFTGGNGGRVTGIFTTE